VAAAAVILLATGCAGGSAGSGGSGGSGGQVKTLAVGGTAAGPTTITRQRADALARSLLTRALLPRGARARSGRPPAALTQPSTTELGKPSAEFHRLWTVAEPMNSVYRFWSGHAPAGMAWNGSGQGSDHGTIIQESVSYGLKQLPAGVSAVSLTMTVAPAGAYASVIRADAQVIWYPARSAAEYIPAGIHVVTVTASALNSRPHTVTKTVTSRSVIARLAAMLNGAYAMPRGSVFSCPLESFTYRLAFAKSAGATPYLVASDTSCTGLQITAGGRGQPDLEAPPGLQNLVQSITHVRPFPGPSPRNPLHTLPRLP
jgi:hypothetical protein